MPRKTRARSDRSSGAVAPSPDPATMARRARHAHLKREVGGIVLLLVAVFIAGALLAGGSTGRSCSAGASLFGPVGSCLRAGVLLLFGALAAAIVPFVPAVHALRLMGRIEESQDRRWLFFTIGLSAVVPVAAALARGASADGRVDVFSGLFGGFVAFYLERALGTAGAWVTVTLGVCVLMAGTLAWNPIRMLIGGSAMRRPDADSVFALGAHEAPVFGNAVAEGITAAEALEPDSKDMPALDLALMAQSAPPSPGQPADGAAEPAQPGHGLLGRVRRKKLSRAEREAGTLLVCKTG